MTDEFTRFISRKIPQTEKADERQVLNSAGGFVFALTPEKGLERFLILGTGGGTFYAGERELTEENLDNLRSLTETNFKYVVDTIVDISTNGRAYKNNAAIFALAFVMTFGNEEAKSYAREKVNQVARISTHLFTFNKYLKLLAPGTGLGTSRNRAIAAWYDSRTTEELAYQAVKYRQREGWTHRDALRQSRPKNVDPNLARWILGKVETGASGIGLPEIVQGFESAQKANDVVALLKVIEDYPNLPWEALPTQFLKYSEVWKRLFYNGQLNGQALVRNITRLSKIDAFKDLVFARDYANKLVDQQMIRKTRLHPINFLNASVVHKSGQIDRKNIHYLTRTKTWETSSIILDALNESYHKAFANAEPSNKRTLLAVDVSGSMSTNASVGLDLSAAQVAGAMASAIARIEPYYEIMGFADEFRKLDITASTDIVTVMSRIENQNFGRTDCALPMMWARKRKQEFDTFVVITDNETWSGLKHPHIALKEYRQAMGIAARLIVVAVTASHFTIADPNDSGMLDVVGCDSNLPKLITEFSAGRI